MKPSRNTRLAAGDRIWLIGESGLASNLIDAADAEVIDQGTPEGSLREPASSSDGTSTGHFA
ncbi:MAG: hypothetical protein ACLTQI_09020 [Slackia sp.]